VKTMQTAGRGSASKIRAEWDMTLARAAMREEYEDARFDLKALRAARPYRTNEGNEWKHTEYAARMKIQHNVARAALRNLNALKAEVTP
jgi:hypothetical protein